MTPPPASAKEPHLTLDEYRFLRDEIRHEDNLINQRVSWLVSSQSFMLTGFAISLNGPLQMRYAFYERLSLALVTLLPVSGLLTCVLSFLSIWGGVLHMKKIRALAGNAHPPHLPLVHGSALTRRLGLSGPLLTPVVFFVVWLVLLFHRHGST